MFGKRTAVDDEKMYLEGSELDAFIEDTSQVTSMVINEMVRIADRHNVDRDNAVQFFNKVFNCMVEVSTFKKLGGEVMEEKREYLKIGSYTPPDKDGIGEKVERDWFRQGWIFKDEDAFHNRPDDVCYIPELSNETYSRKDIVSECKGNEELADEVFENLDWQHVSSLLEDWKANGEIDTCRNCDKLFSCYGETKCPFCGADYGEGEEMKENTAKLECKIPISITGEDIDDIMSSALDSGIGYWCIKAEVDGDYLGKYASEQISRGGKLKLYDVEGEQVLTLTKGKFLKGLEKYISDPGSTNNILEFSEDGIKVDPCLVDSCAADCIVQFAVFGELVYS
ncbi:MAG: hypothetical protein LUC95_12740 [Lachnospiraceae bacterium]|nr:hypothetical protein [Lachnospiraceae bacterium]